MPTAALGLCLALLASHPHLAAKPVIVCIDQALRKAAFAAEAEILAVPEVTEKDYASSLKQTFRLRISGDPAKVWRGFEYLGKEIDIGPARPGPVGCLDEIRRLKAAGRSILAVADEDGRSLRFIGLAEKVEDRAVIAFHGWCDVNAFVLVPEAKGPFEAYRKKDGLAETFDLPEPVFVAAMRGFERAIVIAIARTMVGLPAPQIVSEAFPLADGDRSAAAYRRIMELEPERRAAFCEFADGFIGASHLLHEPLLSLAARLRRMPK